MPKIHICVLEDSLDIQEIVKMIFEEEGYRVDSFSSVADFDSGIMLLTPDLFLLDIMLPDGNGLEVCERVKSAPETKSIPVLMMTASTLIETMRGISTADEFIQKPFDIDNLSAIVARLTKPV